MNSRKFGLPKRAMAVYTIFLLLVGNIALFSFESEAPATEQLMDANEVMGSTALRVGNGNSVAQSFITSGSYELTIVSIYARDRGQVDSLQVDIYDNNPNTPDPSDDVPGNPIAGPQIVAGSDVFQWLNFSFSYVLTGGTRYWIVASSSKSTSHGYDWMTSDGDIYSGGYIAEGVPGSWAVDDNNDLMFRIYGKTINDVGVDDIIVSDYNDVFEEINITAAIKNYGSVNQIAPFDVRCVVSDSSGNEVFNSTQQVISLDSGALAYLSWPYTPTFGDNFNITVTTLLPTDEFNKNNAKVEVMKVLSPGVLKLHREIRVDGAIGDWSGIAPAQEDLGLINRKEYIWTDSQGDDDGDGDYTYPLETHPTNPAIDRFEPGSLDLLEFRVSVDANSINFLLVFDSIDDFTAGDGTDGFLTFSEQIIEILVDTDSDGTGRDDTIRNARLKLDTKIGWEFALWADGWGNGYVMDESENILAYLDDDTRVEGSPGSNAVEISIPATGITIPDFEIWNYVVLIGAQDNNSLPYPIEGSRSGFMNVNQTASETGGGGGEDANGADSNVYDMAFAQPQVTQLDDYNSTDVQFASHTDTSGATVGYIDNSERWAQSFTPPQTSLLSQLDIYAADEGIDSLLNIVIQSNDDKGNSNPFDDTPSGINLSSTESMNFGPSHEWLSIQFSSSPLINEKETYWIVASASEDPGDGYQWGKKGGNPFSGGASAIYSGGVWNQQTDDMLFSCYLRNLTTVTAYQPIYFAPIVINQLYVNGSQDSEWISLYFNGTNNAPDLNMTNWAMTDQDGNLFSFGNFLLENKKSVRIHSGIGINTTSDLFWNSTVEVLDDFGDDVSLISNLDFPVDFMNYTDGNVFGDNPPKGINWDSEEGENIPKNPGDLQVL
jgi:hypothetical protein